jgi:hypothetical protein
LTDRAIVWNGFRIARAISLQILQRKCVVMVDRCNWTGCECDVLAVTTDLRIIDVEVKISRADLKVDGRKDKWWHHSVGGHYEPAPTGGRRWVQHPRVPRAWPPKVWKHYFALPASIWDDSLYAALPSPTSGVLLVSDQPGRRELAVRSIRRAKPNRDADRISPAAAVDIARLANLRMWDAYEGMATRTNQPSSGLQA